MSREFASLTLMFGGSARASAVFGARRGLRRRIVFVRIACLHGVVVRLDAAPSRRA
jgi:hypothetical protein